MKRVLFLSLIIAMSFACSKQENTISSNIGPNSIKLEIPTSIDFNIQYISFEDNKLKIKNSSLDIPNTTERIKIQLKDGDGTVVILPQGTEFVVQDFEFPTQQ